jgi:23S rRNA pseudouridine955/2504/2580 synthase
MSSFSKNQINFYTVTEKDDMQRLDNLLCKILKDVPKSYIYRIIRSGEVRVNKKRAEAKSKVVLNDIIRIPPVLVNETPTNPNKTYIPEANFTVLFEDDYFLIIDKPSGVACHGGSGISFGVIEQLRKTRETAKFLELAHRLDRDTSGVLVLAKKRQALVEFQQLSKNNKIKKYYMALALGECKDNTRNVKAPLYKYTTKEGERRVRVDKDLGQFSYTVFSILNKYKNFSLVKADIKTGRTHQIRVHLQHLGFPIAMDDKYGDFEMNKYLYKTGLKRMFLHAYEIEFMHPITSQPINIKASLPSDLENFLNKLKPLPQSKLESN